MHRTDIFATFAKAATNVAPVPHPLQHQTKMAHMGDAFLPQQRQQVHGGGENSPPNPTILEPIGHSVNVITHSAINQPHLPLKPYQQRVQTMN
jgi:hypothetical protein